MFATKSQNKNRNLPKKEIPSPSRTISEISQDFDNSIEKKDNNNRIKFLKEACFSGFFNTATEMYGRTLVSLIEAHDRKNILALSKWNISKDIESYKGMEIIFSSELSKIIMFYVAAKPTSEIKNCEEKIKQIQSLTPAREFQSALTSALSQIVFKDNYFDRQTATLLAKYVSNESLVNMASSTVLNRNCHLNTNWEIKSLLTNELDNRGILDKNVALRLAQSSINMAIIGIRNGNDSSSGDNRTEFKRYLNSYPNIEEQLWQDIPVLNAYWKQVLSAAFYKTTSDYAVEVLKFAEDFCPNIRKIISGQNNLLGFAIQQSLPEVVDRLVKMGANCEKIFCEVPINTLDYIKERSLQVKHDFEHSRWSEIATDKQKKVAEEWKNNVPRLLKTILPNTHLGKKAIKIAEKTYPQKTEEELTEIVVQAYLTQMQREENLKTYSR